MEEFLLHRLSPVIHTADLLQSPKGYVIAGAFVTQEGTPAADTGEALCTANVGQSSGACDLDNGRGFTDRAVPDGINIAVAEN
jgi:hypothetical protein